MKNRRLVLALILVALTSTVWAVMQTLQLHALQGELTELRSTDNSRQRQLEQCESNIRSAGIQLGNLSNIVQEATAAAAECLLMSAP